MPNNLKIEATKNTPEVVGIIEQCSLTIFGSSFPENIRKFYDPVINWIEESMDVSKGITVNCKFYYMSSSSVIAFLKALKKISSIFGRQNVKVVWSYEEGDEDIRKIGEDYSHILEIPFAYRAEEETL